ncbi:MAG: arginine deiminase [Eubacteriaceae bacterium]
MRECVLNIESEIGRLTHVLLHRPAIELERITPEYLQEVLFEDIPWLKKMQEEHDNFSKQLSTRGVEVFYVEKLLIDILKKEEVKKDVINESIKLFFRCNEHIKEGMYEYLCNKSPAQISGYFIGGICKEDIVTLERKKVLSDYIEDGEYFYLNPLPNLYFMRDPATVIGNRLIINSMSNNIRKRESFIIKMIYKHHELFSLYKKESYYEENTNYSIEGGDILILNKEVIAIGCSQRTSIPGIELLCKNLFKNNLSVKEILVIQIPKVRAFMHLDTVFTMVDYDKFTIFPGIIDKVNVIRISRGKDNNMIFEREKDLVTTLKKSLKIRIINLIETGGGNEIIAAREQWNDSTNTLAISPGEVITYSRNEASNKILRKNNISVIEIDASELVRGRGGPRCMSMPLRREDLN